MNTTNTITRFLDENRSRLRTEVTRNSYRRKLAHTEADLGPLLEVDGPTLRAWLNGKDWSGNTVRSWKVVLKAFYGWANRAGLIETDPSEDLSDLRPSLKGVRKNLWLTEDQVKVLIASCPDDLRGHRDRVVLSLGLYAGLRNAEMSRLTWDDVDFEQGRLHVYGKGQKHAVVGLSEDLRRVLFSWRSELLTLGVSGGPVVRALQRRWGDQREVELYVTDRALSGKQLHRSVQAAGQRVGIEGLCPHDLRRTLAGILDNRGVPLVQTRDVLRHSSVSTTERYLAENPQKAVEVLTAFSY